MDRQPCPLPDPGVRWHWGLHGGHRQAPGAQMQPQSCPTGSSSVCGDVRLRNAEPGGQASCLSTLHLSALKYFLLGPRDVITGLPTVHPQLPAPLRLEHPQSRDSEVTCGYSRPSSSVDGFPVISDPVSTPCSSCGSSSTLSYLPISVQPPIPSKLSTPSLVQTLLPPNPAWLPEPRCLSPYSLMSLCRLLRSSR